MMISEQYYYFMLRKSTICAISDLRKLMEIYKEGQKEMHCVFVELEETLQQAAEGVIVVLYEGVWSGGEIC